MNENGKILKILVIDDERDMGNLIARVLNRKGLEVKIATDPLEAIGLVERDDFLLIIVDLLMPEIDGIEFIKRVRQAGFKNKCIIITAYPTIEAMKEAKSLKVSAFLTKPLTIHELENAVLRAVDLHDEGGDEMR